MAAVFSKNIVVIGLGSQVFQARLPFILFRFFYHSWGLISANDGCGNFRGEFFVFG
jgi:hypothetical protein